MAWPEQLPSASSPCVQPSTGLCRCRPGLLPQVVPEGGCWEGRAAGQFSNSAHGRRLQGPVVLPACWPCPQEGAHVPPE